MTFYICWGVQAITRPNVLNAANEFNIVTYRPYNGYEGDFCIKLN